MDNLKNIAEQLARRTQSAQPSAFSKVPGCGYIMPPPEVKVIPQSLNKVMVKVDSYDLSVLDLTDITTALFGYDSTGAAILGGGGGSYDLSTPAGIAAVEAELSSNINTVYGTTTTTATITLVGSLISINVLCEGPITLPMNGFTMILLSSGLGFPIPITFG